MVPLSCRFNLAGRCNKIYCILHLFYELTELRTSRILLYLSQGNIPELDSYKTGDIPDYFLSLFSPKNVQNCSHTGFFFSQEPEILKHFSNISEFYGKYFDHQTGFFMTIFLEKIHKKKFAQ
jgi:hypothetical protein